MSITATKWIPAFAGMTGLHAFAGMTGFSTFAGMTGFSAFAGMTGFSAFGGMPNLLAFAGITGQFVIPEPRQRGCRESILDASIAFIPP
ncbi:MAG TPA: hypothetical protein VHP37_06170 [Burkholderiales bacterium]|nr:hypothetical protein [Burkholderiales bacterium]